MKTLLHTVFGVVLIGFLLTGTPAFATPILQIDGSGQLTGATGVDVAGTLYDVTFVDGTCSALFSGCDDASDFTFQTGAAVMAAAAALFDQVLIDTPPFLFDTNPALTAGCGSTRGCLTLIPFNIFSPFIVRAGEVVNGRNTSLDFRIRDIGPGGDTTGSPFFNFAQFTASASVNQAPVPEPGTILLLSSGLLGLAGYRWQQRRREGTQIG